MSDSACTVRLSIRGMSCGGCAASARQALAAVPGVESTEVDLAGKQAVVRGRGLRAADLVRAVEARGFAAEAVEIPPDPTPRRV